jgi:hypothetical protein|tara:strand:- start:3426 stop:5147 length:1722 start_codon:yes stop_codon:yes gene_type:complete
MGIESLGGSLLAGRKKKREKENRNQTMGMVAGLGTIFANKMLEKKTNDFLTNENFLVEKRKQEATYKRAASFRKAHETAMEAVGGPQSYYTTQRYNQLVTDFNRNYDEKEYKEGKNGLLWKEAESWAAKAAPEMDARYENSFKIRSAKDLEKEFSKNLGPKNVLDWFSEKTTGFFTGKDYGEIRQERMEHLQKSRKLNKDAVKDSQKILGASASVAAITNLATKINDFRVTKDDWITTSTKEQDYTIKLDNGKNVTTKALFVEKQHPFKPNLKVGVYVPIEGNPRSEELVKKGNSGQGVVKTTSTETKIETGLGYTIKATTLQNALGSGEVVNTVTYDTPIQDPARMSMEATPAQLGVSMNAFNSVARSMSSRYGDQSVADSQLVETLLTRGSGYGASKDVEAAKKELIARPVHGYTVALQSRFPEIGVSKASALAGAAFANYVGGFKAKDADSEIDIDVLEEAPDFDEIDFESSTALNSSNFSAAAGVYALDAFYKVSNQQGVEIRLSDTQLDNITVSALNNFPKLGRKARSSFIENFQGYEGMQAEYKSSPGYSIRENFVSLHQQLLLAGQ